MTSVFARCVPGGYDTNHTVAKALTHASLACALLGCAGGFMGTGYLASVVAMHVLMLIAMETNTRGLLKYCALSTWWTLWLDVLFLASYATDFIKKSEGYNSGQIRGNECSVGLCCIIFMLRFPQFFVWQKLWDLGFKTSGGAPRYVDYNNPAATPSAQPQQREMSSPPQTQREPVGSPFAQPPHASSVVVRSPPPAPAAFSPTPSFSPSQPAVVSFTPASPSNNNNNV